jgi:hypothetical protein
VLLESHVYSPLRTLYDEPCQDIFHSAREQSENQPHCHDTTHSSLSYALINRDMRGIVEGYRNGGH